MFDLATAMSRYGAIATALSGAASVFAIVIWMIFILAEALDSIPVALVVTTTVLLPVASSMVKLGQPRRR